MCYILYIIYKTKTSSYEIIILSDSPGSQEISRIEYILYYNQSVIYIKNTYKIEIRKKHDTYLR